MQEISRKRVEGITFRVYLLERGDDALFHEVRRLRWLAFTGPKLQEIHPEKTDPRYRNQCGEWDIYDDHAWHLYQTVQPPHVREERWGTLRFLPCDVSFAMLHDAFQAWDDPQNRAPWTFTFPFSHPDGSGRRLMPEDTAEASRWVSSMYRLPSGAWFSASMQLFQTGLELLRQKRRTWWINALRTRVHQRIVGPAPDRWPFVPIGHGRVRHYSGADMITCLLRVPDHPKDDYDYEEVIRRI